MENCEKKLICGVSNCSKAQICIFNLRPRHDTFHCWCCCCCSVASNFIYFFIFKLFFVLLSCLLFIFVDELGERGRWEGAYDNNKAYHIHSVKSLSELTLLMLLLDFYALVEFRFQRRAYSDGFFGLDTVAHTRQQSTVIDIIAFDVVKTIAPTFNPINVRPVCLTALKPRTSSTEIFHYLYPLSSAIICRM